MKASWWELCCRFLFRLYPTAHRHRFEREMLQCFHQLRAEPRYRGIRGRTRFWLRVVTDVATNALPLRSRRRTPIRPPLPCQRVNFLESSWRELVFGARKLLRRPGFTGVAVVTMAIGIGANALVFTVVQATLLNPLPYPDSDQVVAVWPEHWFTRGELAYFAEHATTMELAGALSASSVYLGSEAPLQLEALHVSPRYFSVLRVPPLLGRTFLGADANAEASTVVLGFSLWQRLFGGDEAVVGETMVLDGRPLEVIGVMPSGFAALPLSGELWLPMEMNPSSGRYEGTNEVQVIARRSPGLSNGQVSAELAGIVELRRRDYAHLYSEDFGDGASVMPLADSVTTDFRQPLLLLQVAVVFVLLMACVNVANIALAGASLREAELALRSALGASRGQIVRQLAMEGLLIALLGAVAGLAMASASLPLLVSALPFDKPEWLTIGVDVNVVLFTCALALLSVVAFGVLPSLWNAKAKRQLSLKVGKNGGRQSQRLRGALVASEMALAMILIVGAALMLKSFLALIGEDPGFRTERVVTLAVHPSPAEYEAPEKLRAFYRESLERIRALPGIDDAGIARRLPLTGAWFTRLYVEGLPSTDDRGHATQWTPADAGYFRALELALVDGERFDGRERSDTQPVAIVNETFANKFWPNESPVGRRVRFVDSEDEWLTVVGVVNDVKQNGPRGFAFPMIFRPYEQSPVLGMRIVVSTAGDALSAAAPIREAIWSVDATVPISEIATMENILSTALAEPRMPVYAMVIFASIALILGAGGTYGVVSYVISQRTYDIGILFALGAQRRQVMRAVVGQGMRPVLVGMAIGLIGSVALSRFMTSMLHNVSPTDPAVLTGVTAVLTLTAFVACYLPARRASLIDPTKALRIG